MCSYICVFVCVCMMYLYVYICVFLHMCVCLYAYLCMYNAFLYVYVCVDVCLCVEVCYICVYLYHQIAAILCVVSYWQELQDDLYGKQRRLKYYNKLANIRQAALSGNATPYKSYYSSRSMLMLSQSQASLNRSLQPLM